MFASPTPRAPRPVRRKAAPGRFSKWTALSRQIEFPHPVLGKSTALTLRFQNQRAPVRRIPAAVLPRRWAPVLLGLLCLSSAAPIPAATNSPPAILLGMSTALSGPAASLGTALRAGVLLGLERANRSGGIRGQPLRLMALDDGYEPARTAPNMRQLIQQDNVLAIIGNVGTPTAVAAIPIATEQHTLLFAPHTGAGLLRPTPPTRYVINYRASYAEEAAAIINALLAAGLQPADIAFFTQQDAYGDAGFAGGLAALQSHGLSAAHRVLHVRYERNTLAVEDALARLLFARHPPRAVIMVGTYAPCAKFVRLAHDAGLRALFHQVSFVGSRALAAELGSLPARVTITQVVPHPAATNLPLIREFRSDLQTFAPELPPDLCTLEGYIAARILTRALERCPGPVTRERVVDALEALGAFDLGLGEPLQLNFREHQACHGVWLTRVQDGLCVPLPWSRLAEFIPLESCPPHEPTP